MWAGGRWYGLAPALWRVGGSAGIVWTRRRIAKAGAGRELHAMQFSSGEQEEERVGFVLILNFEALPPVPPGSMESE